MSRSSESLKEFNKVVLKYYKSHGRTRLPWRLTRDPYRILVSEIMLQQTQVDRVIPFYTRFIKQFPNVKALAKAENKSVLLAWQGLGYNRRAINLKRAAHMIVTDFKGKFPQTREELLTLPGIGPATAGDLLAFAWDKPTIVIETNIRTVFIHHFFKGKAKVADKEIVKLIEETLDMKHPREWYYALMDYGTHLKQTSGNNIARSAHYKKQSTFKGSNRQLRSRILKSILDTSRTRAEILKLLSEPAEAVDKNLLALTREGLISKHGQRYTS